MHLRGCLHDDTIMCSPCSCKLCVLYIRSNFLGSAGGADRFWLVGSQISRVDVKTGSHSGKSCSGGQDHLATNKDVSRAELRRGATGNKVRFCCYDTDSKCEGRKSYSE
jgi:hypothetical protein